VIFHAECRFARRRNCRSRPHSRGHIPNPTAKAGQQGALSPPFACLVHSSFSQALMPNQPHAREFTSRGWGWAELRERGWVGNKGTRRPKPMTMRYCRTHAGQLPIVGLPAQRSVDSARATMEP
jgi:hypothetical protein